MVVVEVGEPAARARARAHRGRDVEPARAQLLDRPLAVLVVAHDRQEARAAREPGELDGGDGAAARGELEGLAHVQDLPGIRDVRDDRELDPLDVADDAGADAPAHRCSAAPLSRSQRRGSR